MVRQRQGIAATESSLIENIRFNTGVLGTIFAQSGILLHDKSLIFCSKSIILVPEFEKESKQAGKQV